MALTPEEEASLFGAPAPMPKAETVDWDDEPATPEAPKEPVATTPKTLEPPPKPKGASLIMPECADCGISLSPDNASHLQNGKWKHIGCPKVATPVTEPVPVASVEAPKAPPVEEKKPAKRSAKTPLLDAIPVDLGPITSWKPTPIVVQFELGPETLAALKALLAK